MYSFFKYCLAIMSCISIFAENRRFNCLTVKKQIFPEGLIQICFITVIIILLFLLSLILVTTIFVISRYVCLFAFLKMIFSNFQHFYLNYHFNFHLLKTKSRFIIKQFTYRSGPIVDSQWSHKGIKYHMAGLYVDWRLSPSHWAKIPSRIHQSPKRRN